MCQICLYNIVFFRKLLPTFFSFQCTPTNSTETVYPIGYHPPSLRHPAAGGRYSWNHPSRMIVNGGATLRMAVIMVRRPSSDGRFCGALPGLGSRAAR
jgi:hypothetical protein